MQMTDPCCSRLERGASPFTIIVLGWHDGPTSGLARCKACEQAFHFEMLAWDDEQTGRLYAFVKILSERYARLIAIHDEPAEDGIAKSDRMALATRDALAGTFGRTLYVVAEDLERDIRGSRQPDFTAWKEFIEVDAGRRCRE